MPIMIDELDVSTVTVGTPLATPRFFSDKLTGNGKYKSGLLHGQLQPTHNLSNTARVSIAKRHIEAKSKPMQNGITTYTLPFAPVLRRAITTDGITFPLPVPDVAQRAVVATASPDVNLFFSLTPEGMVIFEDSNNKDPNGRTKTSKEIAVQYRMELLLLKAGTAEPARAPYITRARHHISHGASMLLEWSIDPLKEAYGFIAGVLADLQLTHQNPDELLNWMTNTYNVYDAITQQAEMWTSTKIADEVVAYITAMPAGASDAQLSALTTQLRYLEGYVIPLEAYQGIHQAIETTFAPDLAMTLSKQNMNLLLSHTLTHLNSIKPQLQRAVIPATPPVLAPYLSPQQRAAIETTEPLVMIQAGAGCAKSTTINERIAFLVACGIPESDITVLSFTNAAADNISEKNPNVGSMTIASMINEIYRGNYPTHEISSIDTIINSIDIFYPNDQFAAGFRERLIKVAQNKTGSFTIMNAYIEAHFDRTIELLNHIKQTSLELQSIICYQQIETMVEPSGVTCKHLIIDEVQDNSIFEFVYLLKYVTKHQLSLFIVGDASQTLFEFRSANPRALNTLEGSGVFATFKLTTNYRSNQEILDFANVVLGDLETNKLANIRLQANSLAVPTVKSFQAAVKLDYRSASKVSTFVQEELPAIMNGPIARWTQDRLTLGEKILFLAPMRREVSLMQELLTARFPNEHVASLVSDQTFATDVFSKYIKSYWNDVQQVPPHAADFVVAQGIQDNLDKLTKNAHNPKVRDSVVAMISKWWVENKPALDAWKQSCLQGILSHAEFFERLRDNMLSFEIRHNAVRSALTGQRNRDRKEKNASSDANLLVSTIHGAKGLEFDHVVVLHKEETSMAQANRRAFYVAFTRAKKSEYILSYGSIKNPAIQSGYEQLLDVLTKREVDAAALAAGVDIDTLDADGLEDLTKQVLAGV